MRPSFCFRDSSFNYLLLRDDDAHVLGCPSCLLLIHNLEFLQLVSSLYLNEISHPQSPLLTIESPVTQWLESPARSRRVVESNNS